jgi:hypothetical protein
LDPHAHKGESHEGGQKPGSKGTTLGLWLVAGAHSIQQTLPQALGWCLAERKG